MTRELTDADREKQNDLRRRAWGKHAASYDKQIGWFERNVFGRRNRSWACSRATGSVLEVAVGTGLNLPLYPDGVQLTGIDLSAEMLDIAHNRAKEAHLDADLRQGDAHRLPFDDATFDSVVCTYSLCNIPDVDLAVSEMKRVLKPGGTLLLVDHVRSANKLVLTIQKLIELVSVRSDGDHMTRRLLVQVRGLGFEIEEHDRFRLGGIVERVAARKPT